eukprot:90441-Prorocentrum_minimum.AAC.1
MKTFKSVDRLVRTRSSATCSTLEGSSPDYVMSRCLGCTSTWLKIGLRCIFNARKQKTASAHRTGSCTGTGTGAALEACTFTDDLRVIGSLLGVRQIESFSELPRPSTLRDWNIPIPFPGTATCCLDVRTFALARTLVGARPVETALRTVKNRESTAVAMIAIYDRNENPTRD